MITMSSNPPRHIANTFPDGQMVTDSALSLWLQEHWITPVFSKLIKTYKVAVPKELATHTEFMAHPVSLGKRMYHMHIAPRLDQFLISKKQDGVRFWLCFGHDHNYQKIAFMMNRNGQKWIVAVQAPDDLYRGTLLDGEWMEHDAEYDIDQGQVVKRYTYVVFDVLSYAGIKQIQYCRFDDRLTTVHGIVAQCHWSDHVRFQTKAWVTLVDFANQGGRMLMDHTINQACVAKLGVANGSAVIEDGICQDSLKNDGHILMDRDNPACQLATASPFIFKLKHTHTIDLWLILVRDTIEDGMQTWLLELHDDRSIKLTEDMDHYLTMRRHRLEAPYDWMTVNNINMMIRSWCHTIVMPDGQHITYQLSLEPSSTSANAILELFLHHRHRRPLIEFEVQSAQMSDVQQSLVFGNIVYMHPRIDKNRANHGDIVCRTIDHMMTDDRLTLDDMIDHVRTHTQQHDRL